MKPIKLDQLFQKMDLSIDKEFERYAMEKASLALQEIDEELNFLHKIDEVLAIKRDMIEDPVKYLLLNQRKNISIVEEKYLKAKSDFVSSFTQILKEITRIQDSHGRLKHAIDCIVANGSKCFYNNDAVSGTNKEKCRCYNKLN